MQIEVNNRKGERKAEIEKKSKGTKNERKKNIKSAKKVYKVIKWTKCKNGKLI